MRLNLPILFLLNFFHSCKPENKKQFIENNISYEDSDFTDSIRNIHRNRAIDSAIHQINYCKKYGMQHKFIIIIDFSVPLFYKRCYIVNTQTKTIVFESIVSHGKGGGSTAYNVATSNVLGSNCSSVGRYKIADSFYGEFGKGYRLYGLDKTNNNALKRLVVLHYYIDQSNDENAGTFYYSEGCPMMAKTDFYTIEKYIKSSVQGTLLYAYKS